MEERSFVFQPSYFKAVENLEEEDQLSFLKALIQYGCFGIEPEGLSKYLMGSFIMAKATVDAAIEKYENMKALGSKGGKGKRKSDAKATLNQNINIDSPLTLNSTLDTDIDSDIANGSSTSDLNVFSKEDREYQGALFLAGIVKKAGKIPPSETQLQWWAKDLRKLSKGLTADKAMTYSEAMDLICDTMMFASKDMYWSKALNDGYHFINAFHTIRAQMEADENG